MLISLYCIEISVEKVRSIDWVLLWKPQLICAVMDDFQYLGVSQLVGNNCNRTGYHGPTFYLKPICPICDSCYRHLFCSHCVRVGEIYSSKSDASMRLSL